MTHTIAKATEGDVQSYFENLWLDLLDPAEDMETKLEQQLADETDRFALDYGFLTRIDGATETQHFEVVAGPNGMIQPKSPVPLAKTYCRETITQADGTMAISDAAVEGWNRHPAYEQWGFGTYVGTVVTVDDELYGTLCFANQDPRDEPLEDDEITIVKMLGKWVSYELTQRTGPPAEETVVPDTNVEEVPLSPRIDNMMDALGSRPRRFILLTLLESTTDQEIDVIDRTKDTIDVHVQLHHIHLPKLAAAGYIEWDRETNEVSRGPNFSEIEPLLKLLKDYTHEFSQ